MINQLEIVFMLGAAVLLALYMAWEQRSWLMGLGLAALLLPVLYLGIERTTQYANVDEMHILGEPIEEMLYSNIEAGQWMKGKFRTSLVVLTPLSKVHHVFFPDYTDMQMRMFMKAVHWALGLVVLLPLHYLIMRRWVPLPAQVYFTPLFFLTALLLPTNAVLFKTANSDLLSVLLGLLGVLLLAEALLRRHLGWAMLAVVASYLAAQEKLILSPLLLLSIACAGLIAAWRHPGNKVGHLLAWAGAAYGLAVGMGVLQAGLIAFLRKWESWPDLLSASSYPLISWSWIIYYGAGEATRGDFIVSGNEALLLTGAALVLCLIGAWVLWQASTRLEGHLPRLLRPLPGVVAVLIPLVLAATLAGLYLVQVRLAPIVPVEAGYYEPSIVFNRVMPHAGGRTLIDHTLLLTAFRYADLFGKLPTIFWVGLGVIGGLGVMRRLSTSDEASLPRLLEEAALAGALLSPLAIGLVQGPVTVSRYLALALFFVALMVLVRGSGLLGTIKRESHRLLICAAFSILFLAEILPFAPLYGGPFRPIWLNYGPERAATSPGYLSALWPGSGEEAMLLGPWLEDVCQPTAERPTCTLWAVYPGDWYNIHTSIETDTTFLKTQDALSFTAQDYYIFNLRRYDPAASLPEPETVLTFRGQPLAWVFRGDRLAAAGYQFE